MLGGFDLMAMSLVERYPGLGAAIILAVAAAVLSWVVVGLLRRRRKYRNF